jgi:TusA-related sulfurtransferase
MQLKTVLDLRGVFSPLNLFKCKGCLKSMGKGEILEVMLTDMDVVQDLIMIVKRSNDEIIYQKNKKDCICLGIKKGLRL